MELVTMTAKYYEGDSGGMSAPNQAAGRIHQESISDDCRMEQNCPTPESSPPSSSSSPSKNDSTFEPTIDMMVNDFDDEQTLEEEEALAAKESEDTAEELSNLQKESEMSIEELLALYNIPRTAQPGNGKVQTTSTPESMEKASTVKGSKQTSVSLYCSDSEQQEEHNELMNITNQNDAVEPEDDNEEIKEASKLQDLYPETYSGKGTDLLRVPRTSDDEEDGDYTPDEDERRKTIMVGSEFQAVIPEGLKKYDDVLPYENEDKLLWDPNRLSEGKIETYLRYSDLAKRKNASEIEAIPCGVHLRDDEQALYLLLQCGYNAEEALRRKRIGSVVATEQMSTWSEEECRNFESGIRIYGKDFYTIKQTKVKTRSVGELVQFYYIWKKTERHDIFANKARLEKKKYNLHPGITDFMDRFIDEQENNGNTAGNRDRSSSPGGPLGSGNVICSFSQESELRHTQPRLSSGMSSPLPVTNNNKRNTKKKCSLIKSNPNTPTIPKDPLDVGDVEVFSGITTNYLHKKLKSDKTNVIYPTSDLESNPVTTQ